MAPMFGQPNFSFIESSEEDPSDEIGHSDDGNNGEVSLTEMAAYYTVFLLTILFIWLLLFFIFRLLGLRQKTRDPQPRRVYVGPRGRPSLGHQPPTIYVSPANLPPPPKYETMEPPSYEEVVGVHYPQYQPPIHSLNQPITHPITNAVAAHSNQVVISVPQAASSSTNTSIPTNAGPVSTVVSVDTRTSVTLANSV